jgi:hypothetical protein
MKVLLIGTSFGNGLEDFLSLASEANIQVTHKETQDVDVPGFNWGEFDCIVYGYRLIHDVGYHVLPSHIPKIIYTATPDFFGETSDPVIDKRTDDLPDNEWEENYAEKKLLMFINLSLR